LLYGACSAPSFIVLRLLDVPGGYSLNLIRKHILHQGLAPAPQPGQIFISADRQARQSLLWPPVWHFRKKNLPDGTATSHSAI